MIMHNGSLADPLNQFSKALKKISGKRKKTDADHEEMARIEFLGGLWLSDGKPCVPSHAMEAMLTVAARKTKRGKLATAGIIVDENATLVYDGPKEPEKLWADESFRHRTPVRVQQAKIMRTRPIFKNWACEVEVTYDPEILNREEIIDIMDTAGNMIGLGDWRPKFGKFTADVLPEIREALSETEQDESTSDEKILQK